MSQNAGGIVLVAGVISLVSLLILWVTWAAATGRVRANGAVGIRIPATLRSEAAWRAGHEAALVPQKKATVATLLICLALAIFALLGDASAAPWIALAAPLSMLLGLIPVVRAAVRGAAEAP